MPKTRSKRTDLILERAQSEKPKSKTSLLKTNQLINNLDDQPTKIINETPIKD